MEDRMLFVIDLTRSAYASGFIGLFILSSRRPALGRDEGRAPLERQALSASDAKLARSSATPIPDSELVA